jgi:hypothetical protein
VSPDVRLLPAAHHRQEEDLGGSRALPCGRGGAGYAGDHWDVAPNDAQLITAYRVRDLTLQWAISALVGWF